MNISSTIKKQPMKNYDSMKNKDNLDYFIDYLKEHLPKTAILTKDHERYNEVRQAMQEIRSLLQETNNDVIIKVVPDELTGTSLCLEIISDLIVIDRMDKFSSILRKADNFEIFQRTDGNIGIGIVFEHVFQPAIPKR